MAAVVWGYAAGRESQACSQMTLHPEAPRRPRGARSGPCGLQPSVAPLWRPYRDPRHPPRVHSSQKLEGPGGGQLGRRPGQAIWAGATGTWAPTL